MTADEHARRRRPRRRPRPRPRRRRERGGSPPAARDRCPAPAGWSSPSKEFADHLLIVRFVVLLIVLGIAA